LLVLFFGTEKGGDMFFTFNGLLSVISQKIKLLIITAVRISNPTRDKY
jgi:hypothetical protein